MPRFFVNITGAISLCDVEGQEFEDVQDARKAALKTLTQTVRERILEGGGRVTAFLRNEANDIIFEASIAIKGSSYRWPYQLMRAPD